MQQAQAHPLELFFRKAVRSNYEEKLGFFDPELTGYIARMLCEFTEPDGLYRLRDRYNRPIEDLEAMIEAADPIHGTASSFDVERSVRKYIGDYALFVAGMYPEAMDSGRHHHRTSLGDLIRVGRESYNIVAHFNLFEYEEEAPLFLRLAESFERCILGLSLVRAELGPNSPLPFSISGE